ncbi:MAG: hypothetical protein IJG09_08230 [Methanobrevibacter sp.]|nr:hypothetical protein [Methanobrevibacter sp.]MBQ6345113.1 hypothetical protein [Methanobrevibacter sp.]
MKNIKEIEYEIRAIDAVMDEEGCWMWNNSIPVNNFRVRETAKNHKGAFLRHLKKLGAILPHGTYKVEDDGEILEIVTRKEGKPVLAAIPQNV